MIGVRIRPALLTAGLAFVVLGIGRGMASFEAQLDSVHFNSRVPDFGVPPQDVVVLQFRDVPVRPGTRDVAGEWDLDDRRAENAERLTREARRLEARGRFGAAIGLYRDMIDRSLGVAAFCRDRAEVLAEAQRRGKPRQWNRYIAARNVYESDRARQEDRQRVRLRMQTIADDPGAGFLRAHALYTIAAISYDAGNTALATAEFGRCSARYPESPRAESASMMALRSLLGARSRQAILPSSSGVRGRRLAVAFLAKYPRSRFRSDALGWLARADYVTGRYAVALREYKRQFSAATSRYRPSTEILRDRSENRYSERLNSSGPMFRIYDSIATCQMAMGRADDAFATYLEAYGHCDKALAALYLQDWNVRVGRKQAARLAAMLVGRPALLQQYLDFRIHMTTPGSGDISSLVSLGERCLRSHRGTRLSRLILARLAEIAYVGKRYASARRFASRGMRVRAEGGDLALYVFGATSNRMRRYREAADAFRDLIKEYPRSRLVGGARECLALACEKTGRLAESLQQYVTLKYHWDVAYLLDIRMSPADIEAFLATHPAARTRKVVLYALAMRYLRRDHFGRAEEMLRKLSRPDRLKLSWLARRPSERYLGWDEGSGLYDPLRTAHDLARLRQAYKTALGPGSKAHALFALASYYHKHRNLLLYNPSLWKGERALCYEMFWDKSVATQADGQAWRAHSYEHECMARSRALCLEIVHRYPRSSVAPRAAYTAAVDCFRLSTLNSWWRDEDARAGLSKQAVRLMELVVRRYPKSSVARAAAKYAAVFSDESRRRRESSVFSGNQ